MLGTCRLVFVGTTVQFSRLAVAPGARRHGIATALLHAADAETRAAAPTAWSCMPRPTRARCTSAGYEPRGREFIEAGHRAHRDGEGALSGPELRIDPLTGHRVIIAPGDASRRRRAGGPAAVARRR